ncbi:MAG: hypothetical protein KatS3mg010_1562 [Acidimicrobiia bacterium]|nr:MAG: hypothetical protein KatS3mg010_1562 [Acidimicrobiia bacterium]
MPWRGQRPTCTRSTPGTAPTRSATIDDDRRGAPARTRRGSRSRSPSAGRPGAQGGRAGEAAAVQDARRRRGARAASRATTNRSVPDPLRRAPHEVAHRLQEREGQRGRRAVRGDGRRPTARRRTARPGRGGDPQRRGGGEAAHATRLLQDRAAAEEPDARRDVRGDPRDVDAEVRVGRAVREVVPGPHGDDAEEPGAEAQHQVGAQARVPAAELALGADARAERRGEEEAPDDLQRPRGPPRGDRAPAGAIRQPHGFGDGAAGVRSSGPYGAEVVARGASKRSGGTSS